MLKSFLKKRMLNLYVPSLPSLYIPPPPLELERELYKALADLYYRYVN